MTDLYLDCVSHNGVWLWDKPLTHPSQPHLVRIAAVLGDQSMCRLVIPSGSWSPSADVTINHFISGTDIEDCGVPLEPTLTRMVWLLSQADRIIAHNAEFHSRVLRRAFLDSHRPVPTLPQVFCTMRQSADLVRTVLKGPNQWKWPRLGEAYEFFAGHPLELPTHPLERGLATCQAVRTIYDGIRASQVGGAA